MPALRRPFLLLAPLVTSVIAAVALAACSAPPTPTDTALVTDASAAPAPAAVPVAPTPIPSPSPAAVAPPTPTAAPAAVATPARRAGKPLTAEITFYAAGDNDPPGSTTIAFPGTRHGAAGGTGTFDDPLTLASDPDQLAVGTLLYHPGLAKYFVMEDICAACLSWSDTGDPHVDLWTGDFSGSAVTACEHALTPDAPVTLEIAPPRGRPVDATPLYGRGGCATG